MTPLQRQLFGNEIFWWSLYSVAAGVLIIVYAWAASNLGSAPLLIATAIWIFGIISFTARSRRERKLAKLAQLLENVLPVEHTQHQLRSSFQRLERNIIVSCDKLVELRHRMPQRHPITGLETREALLQQIKLSSKPGLLGVFKLRNFDALLAQNIEVADTVLKALAERAAQMVGRRHLIAQIDRATFAMWLADEDKTETSHEFEALCYAMSGRISGSGYDLLPQIDAGSIFVDEDCAIEPALIARASASVCRAGVTNKKPANFEIHHSEYSLEQALQQAIERKEFSVLYQPFVDAEAGAVCGAEALLRWQHPELGTVSPGIFVPIVEKAGLAEEVGLWVLDAAISGAESWQHQGLAGVKVAVNMSAHQLVRADLDVVIARILARHGLDFRMLELELTETVAAVDPVAANAIFDRLREKNISISIDDFGAGYSNLSYLKMLNFDKLKIDREFVAKVDSDRRSQAICQSVIALGRGLGITVLAEGVENYEEYAWLRQHGCRYFQGFYFSKPLDHQNFIEFSNGHNDIHKKTDVGPAALQKRLGVLVK